MTAIMLFHVRSKYTAVGRKEIVLFFYIYMFVELLAIFLDSAIIPTSNSVYPVSLLHRSSAKTQSSVVHSGLCRSSWRVVLVHPHQWLRRLPIPRGRHTDVTLGECNKTPTLPRAHLSSCDYRVWLFGGCASSSPLRRSNSSRLFHSETLSDCSSPTCFSPPSAPSSTPFRNWS